MSIVERAVQVVEQGGKTVTVPEPLPAPQPAASSVDLSITRRDLKPIVEISGDRLRTAGYLPGAKMAHQTEDEIRRIKWPLLNAIKGRSGAAPARNNVILVTSATPGEGKSFTSLSLALSIVRDREMRVILVDGDVARPSLTPVLGLEGRPGLNELLEDAAVDVNAVTYQTDVAGLFFVPSGAWREHASELFASSRMPQVIAALSQRVGNGVIVLDSPPLLATNEAQVASRYVGQVLLVVRADRTEQRAVLDAIALVDKSTPINAVLNGVEVSMVSKYYGQYSYSSGYRHGRSGGSEAGNE